MLTEIQWKIVANCFLLMILTSSIFAYYSNEYSLRKNIGEKTTKLLYEQQQHKKICPDCGLYGYCIENATVNLYVNHSPYNNSNSYFYFNYNYNHANTITTTTTTTTQNGCLKCICPEQIGGQCCDEVPNICAEIVCPVDENNEGTRLSSFSSFQRDLMTVRQRKTKNKINNNNNNNGFTNQIVKAQLNKQVNNENFHCHQISLAQNYFECLCKPGHTGKDCSNSIDYCANNLCNPLGTNACTNDELKPNCNCVEGFIGKFCETKMYEYCVEKECVCEEVNDVCQNGGTCFYNGSHAYYCRCAEGFSGKHCELKLPCKNENACKHGGICIAIDSTQYRCECPNIWIGEHCEIFDACIIAQCENNGTCIATGGATIECDCTDTGFFGKYCEQNVDDCVNPTDLFNNGGHLAWNNHSVAGLHSTPNKCQKFDRRAVCVDGVNSYHCICSTDFTGKNCDITLTKWTFLRQFPDLTEQTLIEFMELIAENPSVIQQIIPFFATNEDKIKLSWDHDDLFIMASFQGQELNVTEEIIKWNDPSFGNCFTFNHQNSPVIYQSDGAGQNNGFEALIHVREDEYLEWTESAGVMLFFHPNEETIFTDSPRYFAAPQTGTQFIISEKRFTRLGGLYGKCVDESSDVHSYYYNGSYTVEGCIQSCYQNAVHLICGCTDPRFSGISGVEECTISKGSCVLNVTLTLGDPSQWEACDCSAPCNKTDVTATVRSSVYMTFQEDSTNLLRISVYFAQDYRLFYNEFANMDFNKYISFFGGVVGVVAGFSVISVVEFGFLIYRLLLTFCTNESVSLDEAEVQEIDDEIII